MTAKLTFYDTKLSCNTPLAGVTRQVLCRVTNGDTAFPPILAGYFNTASYRNTSAARACRHQYLARLRL